MNANKRKCYSDFELFYVTGCFSSRVSKIICSSTCLDNSHFLGLMRYGVFVLQAYNPNNNNLICVYLRSFADQKLSLRHRG